MSEINIDQAAKLIGKSQATMRRWASQKIIPAAKSNDGSWIFNKDEILKHMSAQSQSMIDSKIIKRSSITQHEHNIISIYKRQIDILEHTIERERQINDEMRDQLKQNQSEILKLSNEIKAILTNDNQSTLSRWIKTTAKDVFSK